MTTPTPVADVSKMNADQLRAYLAQLVEVNKSLIHRVDTAEAKAARASVLRAKVSEKGAISLYGMSSKWPVTLYKQQWQRVFAGEAQKLVEALYNDPKVSQGKSE
jgi:hypothetical protein